MVTYNSNNSDYIEIYARPVKAINKNNEKHRQNRQEMINKFILCSIILNLLTISILVINLIKG